MKRTKALVAFAIASVMASCAMPAFAATTSPPTVDKGNYYLAAGKEMMIDDKSTVMLGAKTALAKKLGDGLGVPVTRVGVDIPTGAGISAMFEPILIKSGVKITGLQNSERMKIYISGNNGARAAPAASMGKFDIATAARLVDGKHYFFGNSFGVSAGGNGKNTGLLQV